MTQACDLNGCTVGETGICALERDPNKCEHRLAASGGTGAQLEFSTGETVSGEGLGAAVVKQPVTMAWFPSSRTLGPEVISAMMGRRYITVVGILGDPESGKTACLASLYLMIANAKLGDWSYADSASLMGFEEIARGAREWNEGHPPDQMTVHTEMMNDRRPGFLHVRLVRGTDGRRVDFALPDLPGEWTTELVETSRADRFEFLKAAEVLWVVVDGRSLSDRERRQGVISRLGQLAGRLTSLFDGAVPRIIILVTHRDAGELDPAIVQRVAAEMAKRNLDAEIVSVAPFSGSADVRPGFGIDRLIEATIRGIHSTPEFWRVRDPPPGARKFLLKGSASRPYPAPQSAGRRPSARRFQSHCQIERDDVGIANAIRLSKQH